MLFRSHMDLPGVYFCRRPELLQRHLVLLQWISNLQLLESGHGKVRQWIGWMDVWLCLHDHQLHMYNRYVAACEHTGKSTTRLSRR